MSIQELAYSVLDPLLQSRGGPLKYVLAPVLAFAVVSLLIPPLARMLTALGALDTPGPRRVHSAPVPRGGGIAIFIALHLAFLSVFLLPGTENFMRPEQIHIWSSLFLGGSVVLLLGMLDDIRGVSAHAKFATQLIVAILMYGAGFKVHTVAGMAIPPGIDLLFTIAWFVLLMNAFNLIDGLDGLAAGLALIAALALSSVSFFQGSLLESLMLSALAGACLGFLRFNFYPARIFLGDSGSLFLGFSLAMLSLSGGNKGTAVVSLIVPLLAMGIPLFDTMLAIWRRSIRRVLLSGVGSSSIMGADMEHLHHRLLGLGLTQRRVALLMYAGSAFLAFVALTSFFFHSHAIGILLVAFIIGSYVAVRHLVGIELRASGAAILQGIRRPHHQMLASMFYPLCDFLILQLALGVAILFAAESTSWMIVRHTWAAKAPLFCGIVFLCLLAAGSYHRVWSRARIAEFAILTLVVPAAVVLALGLWALQGGVLDRAQLLETVIFALLVVVSVIGVRALPRAVEDLMHIFAAHPRDGKLPRSTLVVGDAVADLHLIQHYLAKRSREGVSVSIHGLICLDGSLQGRWVYGFKVLGTFLTCDEHVADHSIDEVLVTTALSTDEMQYLERLCAQFGKALVVLAVNELRVANCIEVLRDQPALAEPKAAPASAQPLSTQTQPHWEI
ncbi:MAG: hypothetical protein QY326_09520 [Bdellovibrionota bacterium]|nr:MAG: hypothetical protein QY326_09520 [Bdellovibrionota bacterium]